MTNYNGYIDLYIARKKNDAVKDKRTLIELAVKLLNYSGLTRPNIEFYEALRKELANVNLKGTRIRVAIKYVRGFFEFAEYREFRVISEFYAEEAGNEL